MKYCNINDSALQIYGMNTAFERLPRSVAESVSPTVLSQYNMPAGGRIRFATDSVHLGIRAQMLQQRGVGFDLYRLEEGREVFSVGFRQPGCFICDGEFEASAKISDGTSLRYYTLNFPYAAKLADFEIGIDDGASLYPGAAYINEKPVVFYGSSITHGAWASRPGNTYVAMISQRFNLHYLNLGFSGGAKGETAIAEYMASLPMSAFVSDYDHNAYDFHLLKETHLPLYQSIREKHPDIPYFILTRPNYFADPAKNDRRNTVFRATYDYALAQGDKNVWYIDGKTMFDGSYYHNCTRDGCHPNDLGFFRMAQVIGDVMGRVLGLSDAPHDLRRDDGVFLGESRTETLVDKL